MKTNAKELDAAALSDAASDATSTRTPSSPDPPLQSPGWRASILNGFSVFPEPEYLRLAPESIAPFSLPQEALAFRPTGSDLVSRFSNGDSERMIFCNTELDPKEQRWLRNCQAEAERRGDSFLPSMAVAAGRYLGDAKGDVNIALERMTTTQAWRRSFFSAGPITDEAIREDMGRGILYFCGRDSALRPALVVRPARIPVELANQPQRFNRMFIFCMEYFLRYMIVPGKIENICVILDLRNLALSQVPLSSLMEVKAVLCNQHAGRVFRFYICNMPLVLRAVSGVVRAAMTERQRQKIVFVKSHETLRREFALHHLEEDLGGTRPPVEEFLPFPLLPGPFRAGSTAGPRADAIPHVHRVLTEEGARGRLWDSRLSRADNVRVDYATTPAALDILRRCSVAAGAGADATEAPGSLLGEEGPSRSPEDQVHAADEARTIQESTPTLAAFCAAPPAPAGAPQVAQQTPEPCLVDDVVVRPRSWLTCSCSVARC